jgi:hypothetical protein
MWMQTQRARGVRMEAEKCTFWDLFRSSSVTFADHRRQSPIVADIL